MLTKPLLATNKDLFEKIVHTNLALRKKQGVYDVLVSLFNDLFPKGERVFSISVMAIGIMFVWFFMWSYVGINNFSSESQVEVSPAVVDSTAVVAINPEDQVAIILSGQFWQQ